MIFTLDDILEEMYEEFPDLDKRCIKKICSTGLMRVKKLLRIGREIRIGSSKSNGPIIKFFIPKTPEEQHEITKINNYKDSYTKDKYDSKD